VLVIFLVLVLLTNQEKLDPQSFLQAVGWDEKPGSRLIFAKTGAGTPLLPRSASERRTGLLNMLRSDRFETSALLIPGGQKQGATPIVFIHGLMSTPGMWNRVVEFLRSDPGLAEKFQFWFFYYPTGHPIPVASLQLRETLEEAARQGLIRQPAVLVGHSMGGILARSQAVTLGPAEAEKILPGVSLLPDDQLTRRALIFSARPDVARLIFIATPHRGTDFAHRRISRLGHHLIRLPDWILAEIPPFQESIPQLGGRPFPTSIVGLSPASGFLQTIDKAHMRVPGHSVIPLLGSPESPFAHDGIVPLWSSRLPIATSELLLTGDHGAFDSPESLKELRRILRIHAGLPPIPSTEGLKIFDAKLKTE
jgi:pimeloyl-ACP methyl ester carboxylesterase